MQGDQYNRQLHPAELSLIVGTLAQQYADDYNAAHPDSPISERQAETALVDQALVQVDNKWASQLPEDGEARAWLQEHTSGLALSNGEQVFTATDAEKANWSLYSQPYQDQYINTHLGSLNAGVGDPSQFGIAEYQAIANQTRDQATLDGLYAKERSGQVLSDGELNTIVNLQWTKPITSLFLPPASIGYSLSDGNYAQAALQTAGLLVPAASESGLLRLGAWAEAAPSSTVDSEVSALQRIAANNTSVDGAIFNARISLKSYIVNGDVNGLVDQLDVSTNGAPTGFWSGNLSAAIKQAGGQGISLLETTPGGQIANNWSFLNKTWGWNNGGEAFWGGLSSKYASGAQGDVFVFQTPDKAMSAGQLNWQGGSVWGKYENPVLLQLQNQGVVGKINYQLVEPTISNAPMRWH